MPLSDNIRRVVTTIDKDDKAVILFDSDNPHNFKRPHGTVSRLFWVTDESPADITGTADRAEGFKGIAPPVGGSVLRIVDFPPTTPEMDQLDVNYQQHAIGELSPKRGLPPRHPFMHRTRSVDYALVLSGEIDMLLDEGEIHLKAGDVLVQQGTNHAWVNRGKEPCRIAFVLIDAKEP
jgi:mannose-6-phosphate isomerase-like protein (cupin superfamily)